MSYRMCPNCNKVIADDVIDCPNCGVTIIAREMEIEEEELKKIRKIKITKKILLVIPFFLIIIACAVITLGILSNKYPITPKGLVRRCVDIENDYDDDEERIERIEKYIFETYQSSGGYYGSQIKSIVRDSSIDNREKVFLVYFIGIKDPARYILQKDYSSEYPWNLYKIRSQSTE